MKELSDWLTSENQIKVAGDPYHVFSEEPVMMLRTVALAAERGFVLHEETKAAIADKHGLLKWTGTDKIRLEFDKLIAAEFAGNGLKTLVDSGLLFYIVGTLAEMMSKSLKAQLSVLAENIDKTQRVRERRLGLFFLCFDKGKAVEAVRLLKYDERTETFIIDGLKHLDAMNFLVDNRELKRFASLRGRESYEYLEGLAKAQRIVYDLPEKRILDRYRMMQQIISNGEPVFIEDLNITEDDLLDNDIAAGDKAEQILDALLRLVHSKPSLNRKKALLFYARRYAKNPLFPAVNKIKFLHK